MSTELKQMSIVGRSKACTPSRLLQVLPLMTERRRRARHLSCPARPCFYHLNPSACLHTCAARRQRRAALEG